MRGKTHRVASRSCFTRSKRTARAVPRKAERGRSFLIYDRGGNFEVELQDGVAICRVWSRPDVDRQEGARFAQRIVETFKRLASEPRERVCTVVLDMTKAPATWGPLTQSSLEQMVATVESAHQAIAVVSEGEFQFSQVERMLARFAPVNGRLFSSLEEARTHRPG